jgi:hypothetical protein
MTGRIHLHVENVITNEILEKLFGSVGFLR